jgi:hypothetical protein
VDRYRAADISKGVTMHAAGFTHNKVYFHSGMISTVFAVNLLFGCATNVPEPSPHPTDAHISWAITAGGKEVCKSTVSSSCTIERRQTDRQQMAAFHFFLHAAAVETKYTGTVDVSFLQGGAHEHATPDRPAEATVKPGSQPVELSTSGVLGSAGTYQVVINFTAAPASGGSSIPIQLQIPVTVK